MRLKFVGRRVQSQRETTTLLARPMRSCELVQQAHLQQQPPQSQEQLEQEPQQPSQPSSLYNKGSNTSSSSSSGNSNSDLSEEDIVMEEKPETASEVEFESAAPLKLQSSPMIDSTMERPLMFGCEDSWTWNKRDRSQEVRLSGPNCRTVHFHPNWSKGTAGIRGNQVLNNGRYYWEIKVSQRVFGTR